MVNNVFLTAGARQGDVKLTGERTAAGRDFCNFLSSILDNKETIHPGREKLTSVSSDNQSGIKSEIARSRANAIQSDGPRQTREISASDSPDPKKQSENILYLIDQIMAILQELNISFEKIELTDQANAGISIPEEIKSIVNQSIGMLLEVANYAGGEVGGLARDIAEKLMMLTDELLQVNPDIDITVVTRHFKDLISKMLHEAEHMKAEITVENIWESINLEINNDVPDESSIRIQQQEEIQEPDSQQIQNHNDMKDNNDKEASADDMVNMPDKPKFSDVNLQDDINHVMQTNTTENTQTSEPVYNGPVRSGILDKTGIMHQVAEKVQVLASSDRSEMIIQLKPESLGKIQLQVIHERGEIIARFLAENEQVKSILESNMQYLRDSLEKSGVDIQSLSVSVGEYNQSDDGGNYKGWQSQTNIQGVFYEDLPEVVNVSQTYGYTGHTGDLYGYTGSEINLIA